MNDARGTGSAETEVERVLRFWLDEVGAKGWYAVDANVDRRCVEEFGDLLAAARAGRLSGWGATPRGALALLILLDQLPRNAYRGTAEAFSGDRRARAVANLALSLGHDLEVPEPARQFFYLPLMHSESLSDQERCVRLVLMRLPEGGADNMHHGVKHREVIRRFGRFPSRNAALGRADTDEERAYRAKGGYMG
jgi:uncharacterized protein (DUF924 family)